MGHVLGVKPGNAIGGGGLTVTQLDGSTTTHTLESGKHYILDMTDTGAGVVLTLPAGADESTVMVSVVNNVNSRQVNVAGAGSEQIWFNGTAYDDVNFVIQTDTWAQFIWDTSNSVNGWVVNIPSNAINVAFPTIQKFTSGSGTYTTPAGVRWIRVRMVGGGAGGAGSGAASERGYDGGMGGDSTFGTTLLVASGGIPTLASSSSSIGGGGGAASLGTGPIGIALPGGCGQSCGFINYSGTANALVGGNGGSSAFGGEGRGGTSDMGAGVGAANTGGGGGGGGGARVAQSTAGGGGGSGGFVDAIISAPSATYAYAVGAAGTAGLAGASGDVGAAGGSGLIVVEEHYI